MTTETTVRLVLDRDACVGFGECVAADAQAIRLDEDGTAELLLDELEARRARRLCEACPAGALRIA